MTDERTRRSIEAIWRIESPTVIAHLARVVGDLGLAEDLAQDAFVAALEQWERDGVPDKPGAWLTAVAKRRAIDHFRRAGALEQKYRLIGEPQESGTDFDDVIEDDMGDDLLRLIFICCHPVLAKDARVALTLRMLGGLATPEIARAFLIAEATLAQRIVRAKRTLSEAKVPFELPTGADRTERLASVLEVIYLIFNEGYVATSGDSWTRPALCEDALRLGRVLAGLMPAEPEVHGLVALMEIQASRLHARVTPSGAPVLLLDQDRGRWDHVLIRRGLAALSRAETLGAAAGFYTLQAAIAACHARARTGDETDWARIAALYDALAQVAPSPVVELNRAVAVGMAYGPEAGLEIADTLTDALAGYHLLPAVRGDLLCKIGKLDEARAEFERAASMTQNEHERALLTERASECRRS